MKCVTYLSQVWSLILLHISLSVIGIISGYCKRMTDAPNFFFLFSDYAVISECH